MANAEAAFPSHSGIAYIAKVSPKHCNLRLYVLNVHAALLDNLYICDRCDTEGVPDLMRSSGKHTEEHHLIRCLAPGTNKDKGTLTEQRLTLIEGRLDGMQTQLDDLIGGFNARIGNIEQLLQRLLGTSEGRTA